VRIRPGQLLVVSQRVDKRQKDRQVSGSRRAHTHARGHAAHGNSPADARARATTQENNGRIWVEFATPYDAEAFLNRIAVYEDGLDTLYNRIRGAWVPIDDDTWHTSNAWRCDVSPVDLSVREEITEQNELDEFPEGPAEFTFRVSVRFPPFDVAAVIERLGADLAG
jgi:hypothetical protein